MSQENTYLKNRNLHQQLVKAREEALLKHQSSTPLTTSSLENQRNMETAQPSPLLEKLKLEESPSDNIQTLSYPLENSKSATNLHGTYQAGQWISVPISNSSSSLSFWTGLLTSILLGILTWAMFHGLYRLVGDLIEGILATLRK